MSALEPLFRTLAQAPAPGTSPLITLAYAQSLDGSIAARPGQPLALSSPESLAITHRLRAAHDGILVGVGTVLADAPRLTVRLAAGDQPQPVVLDTHLRTPATAPLFQHPRPPWLLCGQTAAAARRAELAAAGATLVETPTGADGRLHLPAAAAQLRARGLRTLMVEGGAQTITSFLAAGLAHLVVLTLCPRFVGGVHGVKALPAEVLLGAAHWQQVGPDMFVWARLQRPVPAGASRDLAHGRR